jgi:glycosyltransferase involved in cell wall biosynthesis
VCISRIDPVKNLESLLDAWPRVSSRFPAARLVVAGDGDRGYVRGLRLRASIAGREDVEFCGFVDGPAKARLLARADVFALPSRHENFGVSIVEALTAGVAVVTTPEVGVAPFIDRHRLGVVALGEPGAISDAIVALLVDPERRRAIRTRAPGAVAAEFSLAAVGNGLRRMYETVISGK